MKGRKLPHSNLAGYGKRGPIRVSKKVPLTFHGLVMRARLYRHEKTERKLRQQGMTYKQAHKRALKAEHKGLTKRQISVYEGKIGSIARKLKRKR